MPQALKPPEIKSPTPSKGLNNEVPSQKKGAVDNKAEIKNGDEPEGGGIFSPEGVLMLTASVAFDSAGIVIFLVGTWFGIDDYGILDIFGMVVFGGWMAIRSGGQSGGISNVAKKGLKRFTSTSLIELIPFVGGVSPTWTWLVYKTLKNK